MNSGQAATFDFKDENSGGINPSKYFRKNLDLLQAGQVTKDVGGKLGTVAAGQAIVDILRPKRRHPPGRGGRI